MDKYEWIQNNSAVFQRVTVTSYIKTSIPAQEICIEYLYHHAAKSKENLYHD